MKINNPYKSLFGKLKKTRVDYMVIGVSGINYYAKDPGSIFSTQDCDLLVKPTPKNLLTMLKSLDQDGFALESNGEPLVGIDLWLAEKIIQHHAVVSGSKDKVLRVDVVIDGGKIPYEEWQKHKNIFKIDGINVFVGSLVDLIKAKENSGREKDRIFLKLYKAQLKEMLKEKK